tara:strand:+ start:80 stop:556 length:477 start_codon:yes stop_codon:yes gene_type:complete
MRNKNVGYLIIGIAVVIGVIVWIFNTALKNIAGQTCTMGPSCAMFDTIATQTYLSLAIAGIVFVIGLFLIFSKETEKIVIKKVKVKEKKRKRDLSGLDKDEKEVVKILEGENGAIFQKTLMEKIDVGKVKMTRILDKLESREIIERKRRGMNNIVVLR